MIPETEKSGCREKPAHGIAPFPQTHPDGYQKTVETDTEMPVWECLASIDMWRCTILECLGETATLKSIILPLYVSANAETQPA